MQSELKRIQREVGITFVYVTHDQEEALTMSDRLAVMNQGRIEQLGTPMDVYERPASEFVAGFIGVSNLLERDGRRITVRPEKVRLLAEGEQPPPGSHVEPGRIDDVIYLGMLTRYVVTLDDGGKLIAVRQNLEATAADALGARGTASHGRLARRPDLRDHRPGASRRRGTGGKSHEEMDTGRSAARGAVGHAAHRRMRLIGWSASGAQQRLERARATAGLTPPRRARQCRSTIGKGEGQLNLIAWEGYAAAAVGQAVRAGDRLPGQRQVRRDRRARWCR